MSEDTPSLWELSRRIDSNGVAITKVSTDSLTTAVFTTYAENVREKLSDQQGQIDHLEAVIEDMRKTRAAQWFGIGLGILSSVSGIVIALISHALATK